MGRDWVTKIPARGVLCGEVRSTRQTPRHTPPRAPAVMRTPHVALSRGAGQWPLCVQNCAALTSVSAGTSSSLQKPPCTHQQPLPRPLRPVSGNHSLHSVSLDLPVPDISFFLSFVFKDCIYLLSEMGEGREKQQCVRHTSISCLSRAPN